jgi:hypothetical protein
MLLALMLVSVLITQAASGPSQSVAIGAGGRVEVLHQAGMVRVRVGPAGTVAYAGDAPVLVERSAGVVQIRPRDARAVEPSELLVTVPAGTNLSIVGWFPSVEVTGAVGAIEITTREGHVKVSGGSNGASIRTVNGDVTVSDMRGTVVVDSTAGAITIRDVTGDATIKGTSGRVSISGSRLTSLDVGMFSSQITYDGALASTGRYKFATHTGDVTLNLPSNAAATLAFVTLSGRLRSATSLEGRSDAASGTQMRRTTYRIGGGTVSVEVRTFSGNLNVTLR